MGGRYSWYTSVPFLESSQCTHGLSSLLIGKWHWMFKCTTQLNYAELKGKCSEQGKPNFFFVARSNLGAENKCGFKSTLQDRLLHRFLHFALPECWKWLSHWVTDFFFFISVLELRLQFQMGFKSLCKRGFFFYNVYRNFSYTQLPNFPKLAIHFNFQLSFFPLVLLLLQYN